jgi:hypothetical protein
VYNVPLQSAAAFHVISVVIAHSTLSFAFASSRATLDPDERPASRISYSEASQDRYRYHQIYRPIFEYDGLSAHRERHFSFFVRNWSYSGGPTSCLINNGGHPATALHSDIHGATMVRKRVIDEPRNHDRNVVPKRAEIGRIVQCRYLMV